MRSLLEIAADRADQAEVYTREQTADRVEFANRKLHDIRSSRLAGTALRIIKDGSEGQAFTRNPTDPAGLVDNAFASLEGGVEAPFRFPRTKGLPAVRSFDPAIEEVTTETLVEECARVHSILMDRIEGDLAVSAFRTIARFGVVNTAGTEISHRTSHAALFAGAVFPGSATGFRRIHAARTFGPTPDAMIEEIVTLFRAAEREVRPEGGRMKVLFLPGSLITLTWRLLAGTSGKNVLEGISPIAGKMGERVLSGKLTIVDDPRDTENPEPRAFDDEGVACERFTVFEKGVLRGFYNDLTHAAKLGVEPTGHGYRKAMWSADPVATHPSPALPHLTVVPGEASFDDLVSMIDRGIILEGVLGAHSGNIPNGDYSVGVNPALYVEGGEIVGRVKDAMVAGNAYETLREVVAVGRDTTTGFGGRIPAILCDDVSVACG